MERALDILLALAGSALFLYGFVQLRKKRLVEDTPTSSVRGVAVGFAELTGKAMARTPLFSPLNNLSCCYYRFKIEEERRGAKGERHWTTVAQGASTDLFYLDDGTGRILVDPIGAEMDLRFKRQWVAAGPGPLMAVHGSRRRYTEWLILPTADLYILGFVKPVRDAAGERKDRLTQAIRDLKADKERMKQLDADGNGVIDDREWERGLEALKRQVAEQEMADASPGDEESLMVGKGEAEKTYLISDGGETGAAKRFAIAGYLCGTSGAALFLLGLESLVTRLGIFPPGFAIPWQRFFQ